MKVVVAGPPHSGKSTFTAALIMKIRSRKRRQAFNVSFTWMPLDVTDNSIAGLLNPDDDDINRKREAAEWSDERADERRSIFRTFDHDLVLADSPGRITDELRTVISPADSIILLNSYEKREQVEKWHELAAEEGLNVFAHCTTIRNEDIPTDWDDRSTRTGVMKSVKRARFEDRQLDAMDDTTNRMLKQLATDLLKEASR